MYNTIVFADELIKPSAISVSIDTPRRYGVGRFEVNMKMLKLTKGYEAMVDDDCFEMVLEHKWHPNVIRNKYVYAQTQVYIEGKRTTLMLHRFIMAAPKGQWVDHKNRNTLDCRKSNLRLCTRTQNMANAYHYKEGTSKYKGVCLYKGLWRSLMQIKGKRVLLGDFEKELDAAIAYDKKAVEVHGGFAYSNDEVRKLWQKK